MTKRVSPAVIGAFVVASFAILIVALIVVGSGRMFRKPSRFICMFQGNLNGLKIGAPVKVRGVQIGTVSEIRLRLAPSEGRLLPGLKGFEDFYPNQISGGMQKRAGLARAMALDPDILFFDEPSAGLDPISSRLLDDLILELRANLGATIVVVTHELASIFTIANNCVFLDAESRTQIATGDPHDMLAHSTDPRVRKFLTRGQEGGDSVGSHD